MQILIEQVSQISYKDNTKISSFKGSTLFAQINYHDRKKVYLFKQVFRILSATNRASLPYWIVFIFIFLVRKYLL